MSDSEMHVIAFVDYLGFSAAVESPDSAARTAILQQLQELASLRGDFYAKQLDPKRLSIRPAITTFSDNIVISFPLTDLVRETGKNSSDAMTTILSQLAKYIGRHAYRALRNGFLLRGGITVGELYHANGVVFGKGLVDAYRLESTTAIYPRVILSPKVLEHVPYSQNIWLLRDADGLVHLNYFSDIFASFASGNPTPENEEQAKVNWLAVATIIAQQISKLHSAGKLNELAKWRWLATQLQKFVSSVHVPHATALRSVQLPLLKV